ncbi:MAG: DUF1847 domain-containing protein [Oscillospiraceae bacterium]|jgi:uncharacterized metal-binding protein
MEANCSKCPFKDKYCKNPDGKHPEFCSTLEYTEALKAANAEYDKEGTFEFAQAASYQERAGYDIGPFGIHPIKSRVEEIVEFSKRMGYHKLGLAYCMGLQHEAMVFTRILEAQGFEVVSVICKVGGLDKSRLGLCDCDKLFPGAHETMCNPIGQAYVLNQEKTDFNILLGLCVGHDSMFMKNSDAYCTVLVAKDRLMGHNPLGAIYTNDFYYKYLEYAEEDEK